MANAADAKDWAREHMKGLWTSPMYPFTPDFKLDVAGIRHNVDYMIGCKAAGLGFGFPSPGLFHAKSVRLPLRPRLTRRTNVSRPMFTPPTIASKRP